MGYLDKAVLEFEKEAEERVKSQSESELRNLSSRFQVSLWHLGLSSLSINILSLALPIMMLQVYDRILVNKNSGTLWILAGSVCFVVVIETALRIARSHITAWAGSAFEHAVTGDAIKHLIDGGAQTQDNRGVGEQLQKLGAIARLRDFIGGQAIIALIDLPFVLVFLALIFYLAPKMVIVPIVVLAAFTLFAWIGNSELRTVLADRELQDDRRFNFIIGTLSGIHTVKSIGLEGAMMNRYEQLQTRSTLLGYTVAFFSSGALLLGSLFGQIMSIAVTTTGALFVLYGDITVGILIACVLLSGRIMQPVQRALTVWVRFQDVKLARARVENLFSKSLRSPIPHSQLPIRRGDLTATNLNFRYKKDNFSIIENVSLSLQPGQAISIGGAASSGKSTLLKLLSGLYQPTEGTVLVDGVAPDKYPAGHRLSHIGYLETRGAIFEGTVIENLTGFDSRRTAAAFEMAKLLSIEEAVSRLPLGYDTPLKDSPADAIPLGLKQAISIARILANKPKIILFDNADRALDQQGYNAFFRLLGRLKGRVTMVLVTDDRNIASLANNHYILEDRQLIKSNSSFHGMNDEILPYKELML